MKMSSHATMSYEQLEDLDLLQDYLGDYYFSLNDEEEE